MLASVLLLVGTGYLFMIIPTGFLPTEDSGQIQINTEAVQGIGYDEMVRHQLEVGAILAKDPGVAGFSSNRNSPSIASRLPMIASCA